MAASLNLPWNFKVVFSLVSPAYSLILRKNGTVNRRLLSVKKWFKKPANSKPVNGVKTYDVVVDQTRKLWFRVFVPVQRNADQEDVPVLVYFHGGGYVLFSPDIYAFHDLCCRLAKELNVIVVSVNYRLAPEHRHPAQHDDGFDVLKFLDNQENRSKWLPDNANISHCFVAGDSAGGHLAHQVTKTACQFDFQNLKVVGVLAIHPFFGGEERTKSEIELNRISPMVKTKLTDWFWNAFMPLDERETRDHPLINVSGPNRVDISKIDFPATMVVVAGFDILRDWQLRYYEWLKNSGKEAYLMDYPNMFHDFIIFPELLESEKLIVEMKDFIHKVLYKVQRRRKVVVVNLRERIKRVMERTVIDQEGNKKQASSYSKTVMMTMVLVY
ncbi:probable carboxylesterase 18 [Rutidosis leptorrhynchoides]|uniref:probable carboxylesterase 18 n=1 Tax=Rutidosis leptorrhynchoides TaxID=125765 RepID=UPI003A98FFBF